MPSRILLSGQEITKNTAIKIQTSLSAYQGVTGENSFTWQLG